MPRGKRCHGLREGLRAIVGAAICGHPDQTRDGVSGEDVLPRAKVAIVVATVSSSRVSPQANRE